MKTIIFVALALVAVAAAAPAEVEPPKIIRSEYEQQPEGSYNFDFETENGIKREETGELKQVVDEDNKPITVITSRGSYSYPDEQGKLVLVTYYADVSGFHAEGDSIPKAARR